MIKVFGEARSGTTYLEELLRLNGQDVMPNGCSHPSGWKHGFPVYTEGALHVFLMRNVYEWCRSMATGFDARYSTFTGVFGGDERHWGRYDNMIKCRTEKYYSYIRFISSSTGILINTEYLKQNPDIITEFTGCSKVQDIDRHVRLGIKGKNDPDRPELTEEQIAWIDDQADPELESFVDNLTYLCINELTPTA